MREIIKETIHTSPDDQVDLGQMNIVDDEMEEIAEEIVKVRPHAKEIFLNNNIISDQCASLIVQTFSQLPQLSILDLQFNFLDKVGITTLFSLKLTHPEIDIALHGNQIMHTAELKKIEENVKKAS